MKNYLVRTTACLQKISQLILCFLLFVMAVCPIMGQQGPKTELLQPKDYNLWHTIRPPQMSNDGKWISYPIHYKSEPDSLFVVDRKGKVRYKFQNGPEREFDPGKNTSLFVFKNKNEGIGVLHLDSGNFEWVKAERFQFSKNGRFLACYSPKIQNGSLHLLDIKNNKSTFIKGIQNFKFDPKGEQALLVINENETTTLEVLALEHMRRKIILEQRNSEILDPTWDLKGSAIAFVKKSSDSKTELYYCKISEVPVIQTIDSTDLKKLGNLEIADGKLSVSKDGERVFFYMHPADKKTEKAEDTVKVQVRKSTDKRIYRPHDLQNTARQNELLAVWRPQSGNIFQIGTSERYDVSLTDNMEYAIGLDRSRYEPQLGGASQADYYITDLKTQSEKRFVERLETSMSYLDTSPNEKYIAYFREGDWWLYNIQSNTLENATENAPFPFHYKYSPHTALTTPYGKMGWTTNDDLLIYDEYDVWQVRNGGTSLERLTKGRENKVSYRVHSNLFQKYYLPDNAELFPGHDLSKNIAFTTCDSLYNYGYVLRKPNGEIVPLLRDVGKISELRKAKNNDSYTYLKEKNDTPPALYFYKRGKSTLLVQSNPQHFNYKFGKTELISYQNMEGEKLNGLLYFPDDYEEGKQYPMIVNVYEMIAHNYHTYVNPSLYNPAGFNYRHYTSSGYFVLKPDILIKKGRPGISALDCVKSAVVETFKIGVIDKKRIGIIGHSFGGYETSFIVSQTNLFSAAVAGAGIFDTGSSYHAIRENGNEPMLYTLENAQFQMEKSFYENKEAYKNNSPMEFAHNIRTPILIYTGNDDSHVDWHQSQAMYVALRRLDKEVEFLIYENEFHSLLTPKNQLDLTLRVHDWFDKYLKAKPN